MLPRSLPEITDRDRISAARYATEALLLAMRRRPNGWMHRRRADAGIMSKRNPGGK